MKANRAVECFVGKLRILTGELEISAWVLIVARGGSEAAEQLDVAARSFYGSESDAHRDDGKYESHNGGVIVSPAWVRGINFETFEELTGDFAVHYAPGLSRANLATLVRPSVAIASEMLEQLRALGGIAGAKEQGWLKGPLSACGRIVGKVEEDLSRRRAAAAGI